MVKRLAWPVRLNAVGTALVTTEQESSEEILGAAENVLRTVQGERVTNPDYGVPDTLFTLGEIDPQPFLDAVQDWEPRVAVAVDVSEFEGMIARVRAEVSA